MAQSDTDGARMGVLLTRAGVAACAAYTVTCPQLLADDAALTAVWCDGPHRWSSRSPYSARFTSPAKPIRS